MIIGNNGHHDLSVSSLHRAYSEDSTKPLECHSRYSPTDAQYPNDMPVLNDCANGRTRILRNQSIALPSRVVILFDILQYALRGNSFEPF
jgi:hypothetical protein